MNMNAPRHEITPLVPSLSPVPMPTVTLLPPPPATAPADAPALLSMVDHLLQHLRLFGLVWLGAIAAGVAYLLVATPVFRAESLVQIDGLRPRTMASSLAQVQGNNEISAPTGFVTGELEILRSRAIMSQAIAQTRADLDVSVDSRFPLLGGWYARTFGRKADALAAPPLGLSWLEGYAWGGEKLELADLQVPRLQYGQPLWLRAGGEQRWTLHDGDGLQVAAGTTQQAVAFTLEGQPGSIRVAALRAQPGTRFQVVAHDPVAVYDDMSRNLRVEEAGRQSGVIRVSLNDSDPRFATRFLDALTKVYLQHHLAVHTGESSRALQFLEEQLPGVKRELDRAEEALTKYRTGSSTVNVLQENEGALRRLADLERERVALEQRRDQLSQQYLANHPAMISVQNQIATVSADVNRLRGQMRQAPRQDNEMIRLQRNVQVATQLYTTLLNNAQELRVAQAGMTGNARLVGPAGVQALPVAPRPGTVLSVAAGLGLVLALGTVLLTRTLRPTVRTSDELDLHAAVPTLASIPESPHQQALMASHRLWRVRGQPRLLALHAPADPAIEGLRSLRNSTARRETGLDHSSVLISAATTEAGKSFVAANLAVLKVATGCRVLLIDLDLRAPRLHAYFAVDPQRLGLVDVVAERCSAEEAIIANVLPGLDLLLPGRIPGNPGELLMQSHFAALIRELEQVYSHVIIDSAPVLPVGDTLPLGRLVDTTYLVVRSEVNTHREVRDAVRRLESAGVGVDGLILNGVKRARLGNVPYKRYLPHEPRVSTAG